MSWDFHDGRPRLFPTWEAAKTAWDTGDCPSCGANPLGDPGCWCDFVFPCHRCGAWMAAGGGSEMGDGVNLCTGCGEVD